MNTFQGTFSSLGLMVGVIIGAGMFALPYAISRAGLWWGLIHLSLAFCIITLVHIFYSAVIVATPGRHRLPGYARIHLGAWAERLTFVSAFGGFYGALLVYGILGGMFLSRLIPFFEGRANALTFLFFAAGALFLIFDIRRVGEINFLLTLALILCVGVLAIYALPHVKIEHFNIEPIAADWFLPYGVFLFAFAGASAVPDAREAFRQKTKSPDGRFRRILVFSTLIPLFVYLVFIASVLGVTGAKTSPEAIFALGSVLGSKAIVIGSLVGLLAVFTSYLSLGLDLKNLLRYDAQLPLPAAWAAAVAVPPLLYAAGISDFVSIIGLVGAIAIGIDGIIILLSALRVCHRGNRCAIGSVSFHPLVAVFLIAALFVGVVYEIYTIIGITAL
ncbi:MAG: aromatic amino acid permease [Parcubacteria group bacterium Gr01-1014_70]|nr:MAG: aromatic amino acid permease [Parcubacteria group bacterium Gr01-1014_70]